MLLSRVRLLVFGLVTLSALNIFFFVEHWTMSQEVAHQRNVLQTTQDIVKCV